MNGCIFFRTVKSSGWIDGLFFRTPRIEQLDSRSKNKWYHYIPWHGYSWHTLCFVKFIRVRRLRFAMCGKKYISRSNQEIFQVWKFDTPDMISACERAWVMLFSTKHAMFFFFTILWREIWEKNWFLSLILWGVKEWLNGKCFCLALIGNLYWRAKRKKKKLNCVRYVKNYVNSGPVYTGPDKFLHGQKLLRLHWTGGTERIFERLSVQVWDLLFSGPKFAHL